MPQVLKDHVRGRIHAAALVEFAGRGVTATPMSAIARRAGMATGNLYRYYRSKEALLDAVIPPALLAEFAARLEGSVRALSHLSAGGPPVHDGDAGEELLRFFLAHRLQVVILLDRAAGTRYAAYGEQFVARLVALTLAQLAAARPPETPPLPAVLPRVLWHVFENTRRTIASILEATADEAAIRQGIAAFRAYQIPGLLGLSRWAASA